MTAYLTPKITALFALEEEMAEHPQRSRSVRTSGGRLPEGDESEKSLMSRLEKIQHQMNRSAIHGLDVDQELVDAQQAVYASLKALRAKTLEQEAVERGAASAPAPARDSRLQQDIDSGMHPRAAKRAVNLASRAQDGKCDNQRNWAPTCPVSNRIITTSTSPTNIIGSWRNIPRLLPFPYPVN